MFVCSKKYDTLISIMSSEHEKFDLETSDRNVESSFLKIYDVIQFFGKEDTHEFGE
jgi:hypothetical protein